MEARGSGSTLGYKGFVCEKCFYAGIYSIQTSSFRGSLKFNHKCSIQGPISNHHASWTLQNREQELILRLKRIIDKTTYESELIKLIAVRIPYHQFGPISYEEYVDMDPMRRPVPRFIEGAAMQGAAVIYKSEVLEFLSLRRNIRLFPVSCSRIAVLFLYLHIKLAEAGGGGFF